MRVRFGELSRPERQQLERVREQARRAWSSLTSGDARAACSTIARIDSRLSMTVVVHAGMSCVELSALEPSAWPLAELCLETAPTDLRCALSLGRQALPLEQALAEARAAHGVSLENGSLRAGFGRGHLLEITIGVPGGTGTENEQNAAESLVRAVLGDRLFETWIGAVHVTAAPRGGLLRVLDVTAPRTTLALRELFETVAAAVRGVMQGLGDDVASPVVTELRDGADAVVGRPERDDARGDWTMLEIEPLAIEGELGRKHDLVLASTCTPELLRCYLDDAPCASRRFSRSGERFLFVSYADERLAMAERVARRASIEAELASCLRGIGRVTGVGFGVKTSYVDLALCNLETGLPSLVSKLRELDLPARSFIEFFDSELREEWLSIWPDTRLKEA